MISGTLYVGEIQSVLTANGSMSVPEIKAKLAARNIKLDETQILDGLDLLLRKKTIHKSSFTGKYSKRGLY